MLTPPDDLPEAALASALGRWWEMTVASMEYRAVGWGSHHWEVADAAGSRWFVTADELDKRRVRDGEPLALVFGRLRASLAAARDLRDLGRTFVVAPISASDGELLVRVGERFGAAVYPFVDGQSFEWGEFSSPRHRLGALGLVVAVHTAPAVASRHAMADDFALPHRDELEATCDPAAEIANSGPYARRASLLVQQNAAPIRRLLARYDDLATQARAQPARAVLTHGEIHPGNTMLTDGAGGSSTGIPPWSPRQNATCGASIPATGASSRPTPRRRASSRSRLSSTSTASAGTSPTSPWTLTGSVGRIPEPSTTTNPGTS